MKENYSFARCVCQFFSQKCAKNSHIRFRRIHEKFQFQSCTEYRQAVFLPNTIRDPTRTIRDWNSLTLYVPDEVVGATTLDTFVSRVQ